MTNPAEPGMRDPADKDVHAGQGADPYPEPSRGAVEASVPQNDTRDPGDIDAHAPHDRGTVKDGHWRSGIEDAEEQLADPGLKDAWRKGLTQNDAS